MTVSPPTLYWYQLDTGTFVPNYYYQLDVCVRALCTENSVALPTAQLYPISTGTLFSQWSSQLDSAVRQLCTLLSVTPPHETIANQNVGQYESFYWADLDACVRALCVASGGYHADAVHFAGSTYLSIASLTATDSGVFSKSIWIKVDAAGGDFPEMWSVDPTGDYLSASGLGHAAPPNRNIGTTLSNATFSNTFGCNSNFGTVPDDTWLHILLSVKTDLASGSKQGKVYINDVDQTRALVDNNSSFNAVFNGKPFYLFDDTFGHALTGDAALFWIAPNVSLLDGGGDIPVATRRLFISNTGKPVDPAGYPAGAAVFFNGDSSSFATNQGTGGAFTLTGSLTDASTSPSD